MVNSSSETLNSIKFIIAFSCFSSWTLPALLWKNQKTGGVKYCVIIKLQNICTLCEGEELRLKVDHESGT